MTTGLEGILANITKLQTQNRAAARRAVNRGAEKFAENLADNTPTESGEMSQDVVVTGFKGGSYGTIEKDVGYGKSTGGRVKYPDTGTIHQSPQNFKEHTVNQSRPEVLNIFAEEIEAGLKL